MVQDFGWTNEIEDRLLAPIPILLWLAWAEIHTVVGRTSDDSALEQALHQLHGGDVTHT